MYQKDNFKSLNKQPVQTTTVTGISKCGTPSTTQYRKKSIAELLKDRERTLSVYDTSSANNFVRVDTPSFSRGDFETTALFHKYEGKLAYFISRWTVFTRESPTKFHPPSFFSSFFTGLDWTRPLLG
jgi:hypothetical protein